MKDRKKQFEYLGQEMLLTSATIMNLRKLKLKNKLRKERREQDYKIEYLKQEIAKIQLQLKD